MGCGSAVAQTVDKSGVVSGERERVCYHNVFFGVEWKRIPHDRNFPQTSPAV